MRREITVDVLELQGTAFEIGKAQGENIALIPDEEKLFSQVNSNKALFMLDRCSPNLLDEISGLADGLNIDFKESMRRYSGYDVAIPPMGCSALSNGSLYARNYDFSPDLYDARLVFIKAENAYASVGFSQQIVGRLDGMNEKGLVVGIHLVNEECLGEGFLATTIARMVLDQCATVKEATEMIADTPHGYCYNFSILDRDGNSAIVEVSPEQQKICREIPLSCTNHFVSETLQKNNRRNIEGSIRRKKYLESLAGEKLTPLSAYQAFNQERSPLFCKNYKEFWGTLHTVVYSPQSLEVIVGVGGDCEPFIFSFSEWLNGRYNLPFVINADIDY